MVFVYKKLAQLAVRGALPPRRSESPGCAADNKPSCVLHLLGSFIGSRGFSFLERRPEFWVLQYKPCYSFLTLGFVIICVSKLCAFFAIRSPILPFHLFLNKILPFYEQCYGLNFWIAQSFYNWEGNRQEGQGSPNGGKRLQVPDIVIYLS